MHFIEKITGGRAGRQQLFVFQKKADRQTNKHTNTQTNRLGKKIHLIKSHTLNKGPRLNLGMKVMHSLMH